MRPAILLLLVLTAIVHLQAAAVLPSLISTAQLDNTCQCECCYQITEHQTECLSPSDAFFQVPTCSHCTVSECSTRYPTPCSQPSSVVHAKCTTENTAFFRLVPALFVLATIALFIYGFFFKKFDGYHREQGNTPVVNQQSRRYNTFHNDSGTSQPNESTKLLSRHSSNLTTLPTINEEEEAPSDEHPTASTPPQAPLTPQTPHDDVSPAQQPQPHHSSAPLLHDDTDLDTRVSEVATVDSDSTYARDLPMLSEIPQPDAFDFDPHDTSLDVQHANEVNPSAIFERDASDIPQLHTDASHTETKEEFVEADRTRESDAIDKSESLSAAELTGKVVNTETIEQLDSKLDAGADNEPKEGDAQTAHVELQPIQRGEDIAKSTEDPDVTQRTFEDQTPKQGHAESGLLDATDDTFDIADSPVHEVSDIGAESSPTPPLTVASRTDEELDTSIPDDPEPVIANVTVDVDERVNVPSETAAESSAVARIITTDDADVVQSELEPVQDTPISKTPLITTPDGGIEETVETKAQTVVGVSDATVEEMLSEHIEPTDTAPVSKVQIDPSAEDMAQGHAPDVPSEVMFAQEGLQERRAHDENRSVSMPEDVKSSDPSSTMADAVIEAIPDPVPLSENDSTKAAETSTATEMCRETMPDINVPRSAVGIQEEVAKVDHVQNNGEEDQQPLSEVIKSESDNSERGAASVEYVPEGPESHAVPGIEQEAPLAEVSAPVPKSEEVTDSSALVDNSETAAQTETLPPSNAREGPVIHVIEASIEGSTTAIEHDLQEASELVVEGQVITTQEADINVFDHQNAHLETRPEVDDVTVEVEQSQFTEDTKNEQVTRAEADIESKFSVPGVEAEALGAEELEPVKPSTELTEHDPETIPSQTEESGTSDGAAFKDAVLESFNHDGQPTNDSEVVTHDSDAVQPPLLDSVIPETTDSFVVHHDRDLNAPDTVATELECTFSAEGQQQAHQSEDVVDEVSRQENETESLRSAIAVLDSATGEPVDADDVDAARFEQSIIQQGTEQSPVNDSIDVDTSITGAVEAEKAASLENDTEPIMANTEIVEPFLSEPEDAEQRATETHNVSEIGTKLEAIEPEPEAAESSLRKPDNVLPSAMEPEPTEPEVDQAASVESGSYEPVTTESEVTEVEAMDITTTKPLNMGPTKMEGASVEQVSVERGIVGPVSVEPEVEERDILSQEYIGKETLDADVLDLQDALTEDISHEIPSVEETLLEPDQAEQQQSKGAEEKEANEDDSESVESKALEVADPEETVEPIRADSSGPAEISSVDTPILNSEVAEAEGMRSEVIDRVEVDDGLLSAEVTDTESQQIQEFDEETAVTKIEELLENELKDSEVVDATTEGQSALKQFDEEPRTDESGTHEAAGIQISETITEDAAEREDVSTNERTDGHHPDETSKTGMRTEFQEESRDTPGVEINATDPEAVDAECDEVETFTPEGVVPTGSDAGMLERNESLVVEISGSAENSTFSSEGQPEAVEEGLEPAGPASLHLFEDVVRKVDVPPGGAKSLAELKATEAGAASDPLDAQKENAPPGLSPAENESADEDIETAAFTEKGGTATEGKVEEALAIAEHYDNVDGPMDLPVTSTKVAVAANSEFNTSAAYSADDWSEAATHQIVDVSVTDNNASEGVGYVQHSTEKPLLSTEEKGLSNEMASYEPSSAVENADQQ